VRRQDESAAIKILNICHEVANEIPRRLALPDDKFPFTPEDNACAYTSNRQFYSLAFDSKMFYFIEEYYALFPSKKFYGSILKWKKNFDSDSVPLWFKKFVLSLKRKALWEDNKDLGLVLLRTYKSRSCTDILEHIVPYVHSTYDGNVEAGNEYYGKPWYCDDGYDTDEYDEFADHGPWY
jgi:hypothetical protein